MTVAVPEARIRGLDAGQVAQLRARLEAEVVKCDALRMMHVSYAAEANAYRRVLATLEDL